MSLPSPTVHQLEVDLLQVLRAQVRAVREAGRGRGLGEAAPPTPPSFIIILRCLFVSNFSIHCCVGLGIHLVLAHHHLLDLL